MNKSSVVPGYHRGNPFLLQTLFKMEISAKNEVQVSSMYLYLTLSTINSHTMGKYSHKFCDFLFKSKAKC
jgi:hypothetical protein